MKKSSLFLLTLTLFATAAWSQNDRDAFRYSLLSPTGTARYTSMGGSMGAFGADFSTASTNPAALGTYNRSEFTFSPSLYFGNTEMDYNGINNKDYKTNFNFGNLGLVLTIPNDKGDWKAVQVSTGINRMGNFHSYSYVAGPNNLNGTGHTSFMDYIAADANRRDIYVDNNNNYTDGSALGYVAWMGKALTYDTVINAFAPTFGKTDMQQEKTTSTKGSMNEYVVSLSGNYQDKLFFGATLGIPYFSYKENYTYTESNDNRGTEAYNGAEYSSYLHSDGSGINFKIGMLYQPFSCLRLGFALHTPTYYSVEEDYVSSLCIYHDSVGAYSRKTSDGEFSYTINTPYRVLGDIAFIFGNYGFVNIDYEMADYSTMRMRSDTYSFTQENNEITKSYRASHTIKVGGELNLSPVVFRAGYAYTSNPYTKEVGRDASRSVYSVGLGIRNMSNYVDFAYQYLTNSDNDVFYEKAPYAYNVLTTNHSFVATLGWKF
ncbi:MAG: hypothetical protein J5873_01325 [Bacteroidales bacterium]|nr:hypothetical protein [Bacteroidales bacterium]